MRVPSSTPGGMSTESVRSFCTWPEPLHVLQGWRTTRPVSAAFGAGALDREKALGGAHLAVARAGAAGLRFRASGRADAFAALRRATKRRHADFSRLAAIGIFERDFHVVAKIAAAVLPPAALCRP